MRFSCLGRITLLTPLFAINSALRIDKRDATQHLFTSIYYVSMHFECRADIQSFWLSCS